MCLRRTRFSVIGRYCSRQSSRRFSAANPGCVATKYKMAKRNSPPVQPINIAFPASPPLQPTLATLISYGGPGSWKREALWDEYVVTVENHGERALSIDSAALADSAGTQYFPGGAIRGHSRSRARRLEKQYRAPRPSALIRAARTRGPNHRRRCGRSRSDGRGRLDDRFAQGARRGGRGRTCRIARGYYLSVVGINHYNKKAVVTEFKRRRLPLPLTLAPGESRTGSLFFPMVRSPGSLTLQWTGEPGTDTAVLPLDFLKELHAAAARAGHPTEAIDRTGSNRVYERVHDPAAHCNAYRKLALATGRTGLSDWNVTEVSMIPDAIQADVGPLLSELQV